MRPVVKHILSDGTDVSDVDNNLKNCHQFATNFPLMRVYSVQFINVPYL